MHWKYWRTNWSHFSALNSKKTNMFPKQVNTHQIREFFRLTHIDLWMYDFSFRSNKCPMERIQLDQKTHLLNKEIIDIINNSNWLALQSISNNILEWLKIMIFFGSTSICSASSLRLSSLKHTSCSELVWFRRFFVEIILCILSAGFLDAAVVGIQLS